MIMRLRNLLSLLLLAAVTGFSSTASAQLFSRGDLFGPGAMPPMLSIEGGFGQHIQAGTYDAACNCTFDGQTGNGFLANIMYELPLDYTWIIGIKGGVDFKGLTGNELLPEQAVERYAYNGDSLALSNATFDRTAQVSATYLGIVPFVKYQFARLGPFVQLGPSIQFLVSSNFTHRRELLSGRFTDKDGNTYPVTFNNGEQTEVLEEGEMTTANGMRLSLQITGGYDIEISDHSLLAPMITYELPFTTVRDDHANNWKINSLFGSIAIKFRMD
jgi:hypothetical protein